MKKYNFNGIEHTINLDKKTNQFVLEFSGKDGITTIQKIPVEKIKLDKMQLEAELKQKLEQHKFAIAMLDMLKEEKDD